MNSNRSEKINRWIQRNLPGVIVALVLTLPVLTVAANPGSGFDITYPPEGFSTSLDGITVMGKIAGEGWATVDVAGSPAVMQSRGRFTSVVPLRIGENRISVKAVREDGSIEAREITVHRRAENGPAVAFAPPEPGPLETEAAKSPAPPAATAPAAEAPAPIEQASAEENAPAAAEREAIDLNEGLSGKLAKQAAEAQKVAPGLFNGSPGDENFGPSAFETAKRYDIEIGGAPLAAAAPDATRTIGDRVYMLASMEAWKSVGATASGALGDGWSASLPASAIHQEIKVSMRCDGPQRCSVVSDFNNKRAPVFRRNSGWYLPLRFIFEALGSGVEWTPDKVYVTASRFAPKPLKAAIGSRSLTLNGNEFYLAPDGALYVAAGFLKGVLPADQIDSTGEAGGFSAKRTSGAVSRTAELQGGRGRRSLAVKVGETLRSKPIRMAAFPEALQRDDAPLVPLREAMEALGYKVKWDNQAKSLAII